MVVGDLSFFYDLNTLLNNIPANLHVLLVNNGVGTEFKNYNHRAAYFGDDADPFMAAKGHNGNKNPMVVQTLCRDLGIRYLAASNKEEYLAARDTWIAKGPVLLEVFTSDQDESDALRMVNSAVQDTSFMAKLKKSLLGRIAKKLLRR